MLVACWSAKGGSGTTVVAVALAAVLARSSPAGAVLADLAGDAPAALGVPDPAGPGLADWMSAGGDVPVDALARLEVIGPAGIRLLPWGGGRAGSGSPGIDQAASGPAASGPAAPGPAEQGGRGDVLAALLAADPRPVVVDCGCGPIGAGLAVAGAATASLLVTRPCYLALRRAVAAPVRPSGVVVVSEPGRSLLPDDIAEVLGVPVRAVIAADPAVARAVDAGVLPNRLPRRLERAVRRAA